MNQRRYPTTTSLSAIKSMRCQSLTFTISGVHGPLPLLIAMAESLKSFLKVSTCSKRELRILDRRQEIATPDHLVLKRKYRLGTLEALSESMRKVTRTVAASNMYTLVYDNINMVWKVAEQILGRTGMSL